MFREGGTEPLAESGLAATSLPRNVAEVQDSRAGPRAGPGPWAVHVFYVLGMIRMLLVDRGKASLETTSNIVTAIAILISLMNGAFRAPSLAKRNIHKRIESPL